ncbi:hypothetical protein Bpfe_006981 [Biomphalaria pfeifferi]|uniref:Uncharacterized protein n=1 Tax=Biomphalaria pfeifferi TaxID=112525 RepID=A0AAD8BZ84_BIOPF|nr:hypothetical protein Bpfe_006981 [Biomphalaria pfeifferi]
MVSQVDSLVKEQLTVDSLVKTLRDQDCGCTNDGDGDAGDWSAVCVVGKSCGRDFQDEKRDNNSCDDLNEMYRVERKETNEETEVCYVPEAFVPVVPVTSTLTEICYVPEAFVPVVPVTSTLTEICYVPEAFAPVVPVTSTLTEICYVPEAFLSRGRHFPLEPEETYLLDVRLLSEDDCGALDFVWNVAASEPAAPLRGVCREGLRRRRVRSTAVLKKTVLDTISMCVKRPVHRRHLSWRQV